MVPITKGEAWVMISVDENGHLTDALPTRYSHALLADEALRVLKLWSFEPARVNGEPVPVRVEVRFTFEATGAVISLDTVSAINALTAFANRHDLVRKLCDASELDHPPQIVRTVAPIHPGVIKEAQGAPPSAVLEFIIDEDGRTRMPALISTSGAIFANSAADALGKWQFAPPTCKGRPTAVKVRQTFVFQDPS